MGRLLTIFLFSFIFLLLPFFGEAEDGFLEFYLGLSNDRINPKIIGGTSSSTGFELEYAPIELKRKGPTPVEATGISLNNSLETIDDAIGVVFFSSPVAPINNVGTMEQLITHYGQDSQGKNNPIWNDIFFPNGQFKQKFSIKQMNNFDVSPYVEKRTSSNKQIPVISTQISRMIAETIKSFAKGDINLSLSNVPFDPAEYGLIIHTYGLTNPAIGDALNIDELKNFHSTTIITDSSRSIKSFDSLPKDRHVKGSDKVINNFLPEDLSDGEQGAILKELIDNGYTFSTPHNSDSSKNFLPGTRTISMNALEDEEREPLMHEKHFLFYKLKDKNKALSLENIENIFVITGSANSTDRYYGQEVSHKDSQGQNHNNTMLLINSAEIGKSILHHSMRTHQVFTNETDKSFGRIRDLKTSFSNKENSSEIPNLFTAGDSAFSFFDSGGSYLANQRHPGFYINDIRNKPNNSLTGSFGQLFVTTFANGVYTLGEIALHQVLQKKLQMPSISLINDARFAGEGGNYGLSPLLIGKQNYRPEHIPMTKLFYSTPPFGSNLAMKPELLYKTTDVNVFLAYDRFYFNVDQDSSPRERSLEHNKTLVDVYSRNGESRAHIMLGSYNYSTTTLNAENRLIFETPADSGLNQILALGFLSTKARAQQQGVSIPLKDWLIVKHMSDFIGQFHMDLKNDLDLGKPIKWFSKDDTNHFANVLKIYKDFYKSLNNPKLSINSLNLAFNNFEQNIKHLVKFSQNKLAKDYFDLHQNTELKAPHSRLIEKLHLSDEQLNTKLLALKSIFNYYFSLPAEQRELSRNLIDDNYFNVFEGNIHNLFYTLGSDARDLGDNIRKLLDKNYLPNHQLWARSTRLLMETNRNDPDNLMDLSNYLPNSNFTTLTTKYIPVLYLNTNTIIDLTKLIINGNNSFAANEILRITKDMNYHGQIEKHILYKLKPKEDIELFLQKLNAYYDQYTEIAVGNNGPKIELSKEQWLNLWLEDNLSLIMLTDNDENIEERNKIETFITYSFRYFAAIRGNYKEHGLVKTEARKAIEFLRKPILLIPKDLSSIENKTVQKAPGKCSTVIAANK